MLDKRKLNMVSSINKDFIISIIIIKLYWTGLPIITGFFTVVLS